MVGVILHQNDNEGRLHPIHLDILTVDVAKINYTLIEIETLTVVFAFYNFIYY